MHLQTANGSMAARQLTARLLPFTTYGGAAMRRQLAAAMQPQQPAIRRPAGLLGGPSMRTYSRHIVASAAADVSTAVAAVAPSTHKSAKMSGSDIREAFLAFFESKGHTRLPSASLVPDDPTVLLTIAGMLQFKPVFLGQAPRKVPRATTTQKCVRTNDIENVGITARHHTFFEMLGNFSFGDYFKQQAIQWAWELSTQVYRLPPERVWVSVYEEDDEAYALWRDVVGVPPERIKRMGAADNFWASGPTGPCGPCSELYYDFHPERGTGPETSLEDDSRFIEFYNLVFMELNRDAEGKLTPLAAKNIDTGMGLERMAQILQGVPNNYETDLIFPIVAKAATVAGVDYTSSDATTRAALKVIGDHTRAVTYLISDGVLPSNVGRGYVVRRLLRRVVMKGRLLGIRDIFTPHVAEVAIELSGGCDPQVAANAKRVCDEMAREESIFVATLEKGQKILDAMLERTAAAGQKLLSGPDAFLLYDSFGFPLELTQELAELRGIQVDTDGFAESMERQRQRSKDSREEVDLTAQSVLGGLASAVGPTAFTGYTALEGRGRVVGLLVGGQQVQEARAGDRVDVLLDSTPFYAESGGQVGDTGRLVSTSDPSTTLDISDVQKAAGGQLSLHTGTLSAGVLRVGDEVSAAVDAATRRRTAAHHTATHLLQSALKQVLGQDTAQQGSLVTSDRLRFDFSAPKPMTAEELIKVQALVNGWVSEGHAANVTEVPIEEARAAGAVAMFGEKYGDVVRVVDVPGVSMELCGGTHVENTAQIGAFKIVSEGGIASGVRRIEAVAGLAAVEYLNGIDAVVRTLAGSLKARTEELPKRVAGLQEELKGAYKEVEQLRAALAVAKAQSLTSEAVSAPNGGRVLVAELPGVDAKAMDDAATTLLAALGDPAAVVLGTSSGDKANFVAVFSPAVVKGGMQAGKVVGAVAKVCGGGGGGKPAMAKAGGKDASKLHNALALAKEMLMGAL